MRKKDLTHIDLDNFWAYHAVVLADQISRYTLSVVKAEADLNISQWRVLAAVADKPGRTAAEVTHITPMDKTIVSRAVSSLIEANLIKKEPSKTDKRRQSLQTTLTGQNIYEKIALRLNHTMITTLLTEDEHKDIIRMVKNISSKMRLISSNSE